MRTTLVPRVVPPPAASVYTNRSNANLSPHFTNCYLIQNGNNDVHVQKKIKVMNAA
jgi:hypothetical protein